MYQLDLLGVSYCK